jgi:DNA invertase Pin-like site-specific DNA recombinase
MRTAVAIYARTSQDRTGEGLGVERQLKDCRAEAERREWLVAQEYVDDDISGDGLLVARLLSVVAANESDAKAHRTKRKMQDLAKRGLPRSGGVRPFGFNDDRMTDKETEAAAIRELFARFLAGESISSLVEWLDESGIRPVTGQPWRSPTVRNILKSPRNAGRRSTEAEWSAQHSGHRS